MDVANTDSLRTQPFLGFFTLRIHLLIQHDLHSFQDMPAWTVRCFFPGFFQ